jgi:hypothetical protein
MGSKASTSPTVTASEVENTADYRPQSGGAGMATNKPVGDNARKGAVRKRAQRKGKLMGKTAWTKRSKKSGQFMGVKKSKKKFKGVRREA